jgi:bifunctional ADP-heptose synthase (sugar kinase/adenylyltransferase)
MNQAEFFEILKDKQCTIESVMQSLDKIKDVSILIVGDTIIDEYQYGVTLGKSGKAPIVAFQEEELECYPGGILAIFNHLKEFANVDYYTSEKATIKKRFIQGNQKLFETYHTCDNRVYKEPNNRISDYDIVMVADFGHGFIDKKLQDKLECESKYIALNTQLNAGNLGFNTINKYTHRNYICIDHNELRLATSNQFDSIRDIISQKFKHETVSITESSSGAYLFRNKEIIQVPAFAEKVVDTVGAGDAYFSLTSPLAYTQTPLEVIGFIGNVAGAIACTYPGNKEHVTRQGLEQFIKEIYDKI